jgi:hypothetical protein
LTSSLALALTSSSSDTSTASTDDLPPFELRAMRTVEHEERLKRKGRKFGELMEEDEKGKVRKFGSFD